MSVRPNKLSQFWQELKRRKVVRVITVYAASAFVLLELVDIITEPFGLPSWTLKLVVVLLAVGLVVAIILSWIYDIHPEGGIVKTEPAHKVKSEEIPASSNSWKIASYISFVVIVGLVVLNIIPRASRSVEKAILDKSIAVLPFINESSDKENTYFINGVMESVLNNLSKIEDLRVVSRTSVEQYRNNLKPAPEIAEEMKVSYILEGSGQKLGDRILLTIQLIDGIDDRHLWSRQYDREILEVQDLIDIQSEVAQLVAAEIKAIITPEEKQLIEKTPTTNLTAYDLFQKGREEHRNHWSDLNNNEALDRAEDLYFETLKFDSTFAQAYTGLAFVYRNKNYWNEFFSQSFLDSGLLLSDIALSHDKQLSEAYIFKGRYFRATGNSEQAIKELDKAIRYNPNNYLGYLYKAVVFGNEDNAKCLNNLQKTATLNRGYLWVYQKEMGFVFRNAGFQEIAKSYWQEALKLTGDSAEYYLLLSSNEICLDNPEEAIELYNKALAIDSTRTYVNVMNYVFFGNYDLAATFMLFDQEEALEYAEKYMEVVKIHGEYGLANMHRVGYAYWLNGYKDEAAYYFNKQMTFCINQNQLGRTWSEQLFTYYDLAGIYAFRGEKEKAYENLRIFNQRKIMHQWMVWNINNDPLFNSIRDEPEFQQIVTDVEVKYQAEHERVRKWLEENDML